MIGEIITDRLILRNYQESDIESILRLRSCPDVWVYSTNQVDYSKEGSLNYWKEVSLKYSEGKCAFQALFLKENLEFIGEAGVVSFNEEHNRAIIGYNILQKFWNMGYSTEITKSLLYRLFNDFQVERIEALTMESNNASRRVLEKSGFQLEGILKNYAKVESEYRNICYYGIIRPKL
ncbi:GNAT family protein [Herbivorax sp. ANBcel31]|uniref:GNAT family N-acetyltransferase n=1 Tax=Herbivorax sp. ANBcel31 TaxID=3069754 RepID=UPI0027B3BDFE|nr:GNAT family protein [Herbivorax sp. ANBcel31]MDQ2087952.1 GNAT family protein [Herbivorax sp. ANBcel31]